MKSAGQILAAVFLALMIGTPLQGQQLPRTFNGEPDYSRQALIEAVRDELVFIEPEPTPFDQGFQIETGDFRISFMPITNPIEYSEQQYLTPMATPDPFLLTWTSFPFTAATYQNDWYGEWRIRRQLGID
jgi:hypothetical protein